MRGVIAELRGVTAEVKGVAAELKLNRHSADQRSQDAARHHQKLLAVLESISHRSTRIGNIIEDLRLTR